MSDTSKVPSTGQNIAEATVAHWHNTNVVFQKILLGLDAEDRSKIVLRCDDLPMVTGNESDWEALFRGLLQMILQKKDAVPTLFLHISCTADEKKLPAENGCAFFTIQFNSNIIPSASWFENNKMQLNSLQSIAGRLKGDLALNPFKASGCIFSLSLPGKAV